MQMQVLLRLIPALSVLFLSQMWVVPSFAGKIGPEFQVNSVTTARQTRPRVATFSDGSFVVVWSSENQDPNNTWGVYARHYRPDGTRKGPEFRVNRTIADSQGSPEIAALSNDGFVVVWSSLLQDGSENGVYGQRFRADGTRAGPEFKVNTRTINIQQAPAVAALAGGGFVVTWESWGQDGSGIGIYGQRYSSNGARVGLEFRVNTTTAGDQNSPAVAGLGNGGFVVVWTGNDSDGRGIFGQRFNSNGVRSGGQFPVNTITAEHQGNVSITAWGQNGFVVVWDSPDNANSDGVHAQRFDAQGRVGSEFLVNTTRIDFQINAALAPLSNGGFVVLWESYRQGSDTMNDSDIFGQRYTANGQRAGSEFRVNTVRVRDQGRPNVAALPNGGFVVVWDSAPDGSDYDAFGQRYAN